MALLKQLFIAGFLMVILSAHTEALPEQNRFCHVFGSIAITEDPRRSHYKVFIEDSEGLADIIVFEEEIQLYADRRGIWHFMDNPGLADYVIFFEETKSFADFSIYYTDIESFAGCQ